MISPLLQVHPITCTCRKVVLPETLKQRIFHSFVFPTNGFGISLCKCAHICLIETVFLPVLIYVFVFASVFVFVIVIVFVKWNWYLPVQVCKFSLDILFCTASVSQKYKKGSLYIKGNKLKASLTRRSAVYFGFEMAFTLKREKSYQNLSFQFPKSNFALQVPVHVN